MNVTKEESIYQYVGSKIKFFREHKLLSQTSLASKVNLSRTSIVSIEQGKQRASLALLWLIAESLDVTIQQLLPAPPDLIYNDREVSEHSTAAVDESSQAKLSEFMKKTVRL